MCSFINNILYVYKTKDIRSNKSGAQNQNQREAHVRAQHINTTRSHRIVSKTKQHYHDQHQLWRSEGVIYKGRAAEPQVNRYFIDIRAVSNYVEGQQQRTDRTENFNKIRKCQQSHSFFSKLCVFH